MASDGQETNRDRVRRILIRPLQEAGMGMKPKKGERPAEREARERAFLDGLADELGYCCDRVLAGLREWAEASGEGTRRNWWPARVGFLATAQRYQPRPLEQLPAIASWFGSRAGAEARAVPGRLVAEFQFIERHRRPPIHDTERRALEMRAREIADTAARLRCRVDENRADASDRASLGAYDDIERRALAIVAAGETARREGTTA